MSRKLLITGLNGLIGWNLFQFFQDRYDVYATYRSPHPKLLLEKNCFRIDLDSEKEIRQTLNRIQPDIIIHSRAICDLDVCEEFPELAERVNVKGTELLLKEISNLKNLERFIFISTDHVFDGEKGSYTIDDEPKPKHVYGKTKRSAELAVLNSGLPFLIIRPGLVIGDSLQGNKGPKDFLCNRLRKKKETTLFVDEWRSPVSADRLCQSVGLLIQMKKQGIFHIAEAENLNRFDLGISLAEKYELPSQYILPQYRKNDILAHIRPRDISLFPSPI